MDNDTNIDASVIFKCLVVSFLIFHVSQSSVCPFFSHFQCLEKFPVIQHFKFGSLLSIQPVKPWTFWPNITRMMEKTKIPTVGTNSFTFLWHPHVQKEQ